jgi:TolB-like protein/tetratricopeptide (TPR) repeat protein
VTDATIGRVQVLWDKLQRRKVVQWGIAYCLFAWGLLQGLEYLSSTFGWPQLLQQLATLASLIGLPIVLVVAWYHGDRGEQQIGAAEFLILFGLLLLGGALFWWFGSSSVSTAAHQGKSNATTPAPDRSIAVLPFDNLSGDPANGFLGDGLAEELANLLTRIPDLEVASRTSAFSFKGRKMTICDMAAELGVKYLVEGSLRRNGDTLSITAQLIECPRGTHAWSNTYRRPIAELPSVEDDIAGSVVEALKIILAPETRERMQRRSEVNQDAYESYLQAISELRTYTDTSSLDRAVERFRESTIADPTYAEAYAGLCEAYVRRYIKVKAVRDVAEAESACEQAVRLDRGLPEVHTALGALYITTGQHEMAEREYRQAIELDPDGVEAYLGLGRALKLRGDLEEANRAYREAIRLRSRYWKVYDAYGGFLYEQGRLAEAIAQFRRGLELAPQNAQLFSNLGSVLFLSGEFTAAADAFRRSVDIAPTSEGYSNTGTNYYYAGRYDDAVAMFEKATEFAPEDFQLWGNLGDAYLRTSGKVEQSSGAYRRASELARSNLAVNPESASTRAALAYFLVRLGNHSEAATEIVTARTAESADLYTHYYAALVYKGLGNNEIAIAETRRALEAGYPASLLRADTEFAPMIRSPEIAALVGEAGK